MSIPGVLSNNMSHSLYHDPRNSNYRNKEITEYRNTNYRNLDMEITEIPKYNLRKYGNTNDRNKKH